MMPGLCDVVGSIVPLPAGRNRKYGVSDLSDGMVRGAILDTSVGGAANGMRSASEAGDARAGHAVPSDEWFRLRLLGIDEDNMACRFRQAVSGQLDRLGQAGMLPVEGLTVAIDMHLISRYDRTRGPELARSRYKNGTKYFERYITAQAVNPGARLNLAALGVPALTSGPDMAGAVLDGCLAAGAKIGLVLMDREFFAMQTIDALNSRGIDYLMPARNTPGVAEALREFAEGTRNAVSEYVMHGRGKSASCFLSIVRRKGCQDPNAKPEEKYIGFATSVPGINPDAYAARWGIETGYAKIESMRAKTRSRNRVARLFCFLYSLLLFNLWVAANALLAFRSGDHAGPKTTQTALKFVLLLWILGQRPGPEPPPGLPDLPGVRPVPA